MKVKEKSNVEKADKLGILEDLKENHSEEYINQMDAKEILGAWLEWEGIIGYTNRIIQIFETFKK